jgi:hypothetical protein
VNSFEILTYVFFHYAKREQAASLAAQNPVTAAVGTVGLAVVAAPAIVTAPILYVTGFGAPLVAGRCPVPSSISSFGISNLSAFPVRFQAKELADTHRY